MFSGPDFLYADAFYSKATTYVFSALEPVGSVPDLTKLPNFALGPALDDVERSLSSILSFSFFITTIIAAEMTARRCSCVEIDPGYCDVAIARWQAFTRETARLEDGTAFGEVKEMRGQAVDAGI